MDNGNQYQEHRVETVRSFLGSPFWHTILKPILEQHRVDAYQTLANRAEMRKSVHSDDYLWGQIAEAEKLERELVNLVRGHDQMVEEQASHEKGDADLAPLVVEGRFGPHASGLRNR